MNNRNNPKSIDSLNSRKQSALIRHSSWGDKKEVGELIKAGANLNLRDNYGETALIIAIKSSHTEIASMLIEASADISIKNYKGLSAISEALLRENIPIIKMLLDKNSDLSDKDPEGNTLFVKASSTKNFDLFKLLLAFKPDLNTRNRKGFSLIHKLIYKKDLTFLKFFIEQKPDLNIKDHFDNTPLMYAISEGKTEAALILIQSGAKLNEKNSSHETAFDLAFRAKNFAVISALIDAGTDLHNPDYSGEDTPLMKLIPSKNSDNALKLIDQGANLETKNASNIGALDIAIKYENIDVIKKIIEKKGSIDYVDEFGESPTYDAIKKDKTAIATLLIQAGVKVNREDGRQPLLQAAYEKNHTQLIRVLVEAKAHLDDRKDNWLKCTFLMTAIQDENTVFAEALIENGASLTLKNNDGNSAFNIALKLKNFHILGILLNHGQEVQNPSELIKILKKEDEDNLDFPHHHNRYVCLDILKDPFIQSSNPEQHTIAKKEIADLKEPTAALSAMRDKVFQAVDAGTGFMQPRELAKLVTQYDDTRFRLFKSVQKAEPYLQPSASERAEKNQSCLIM